MANVDVTVSMLKLLRGLGGEGSTAGNDANNPGFKILTVVTTEPAPYTFIFEGTAQALDIDLFEIPVSMYPLVPGQRLFVYPLVGSAESMRWAAFSKLDGGVPIANVIGSTSVQVPGIGRPYDASDLILPAGGTLPDGKRVSLAPTDAGGMIQYVVLEIHD